MTFRSTWLKWTMGAAAVAAAVVISGVVVRGGAVNVGSTSTPAAAFAAAPVGRVVPAVASYADAVDRAAPAVVTIQIERRMPNEDTQAPDELFQRFFGPGVQVQRMPAPVEHGLGSGVIVSADGNILTNNHVVDGAGTVHVTLADGREFTAKVVGTDPKTDLAVVHIAASNLPAIALADSDQVRVGDVVLALGNPLGIGETVTMGIISAKGRTTNAGPEGDYEDFLQTDAPINQGNSGGALITTNGELVGINSQIVSPSGGSIGIGFAIPSDLAKNVMAQLLATGHVRRGLLGVTVQSITSDLAKSLSLKSVHGALVSSVEADGPAAKAGIQTGDVILDVNGTAVTDSNDLRNRISERAPGETVTLAVERAGAPRTMTAKLAQVPDDQAPADHSASVERGGDGLTATALTPALAQRYQVAAGVTGVVVTNVASGSAAERAGLRAGDVIRDVNGVAVKTSAELTAALAQRTDRPVLVYAQRGDQAFYVAVPRG